MEVGRPCAEPHIGLPALDSLLTMDDTGRLAEQMVVELLREQLPAEAEVISPVRITHDGKECEIDALVLWPGVGTAVVEVKSGQLSIRDGVWRQSGRSGSHKIDSPIAQAQSAKYQLIEYFRTRLPSFGGIGLAAHCAVFPYTRLPEDFETSEAPDELLIDSAELDDIAGHIERVLRRQKGYHQPISAEAMPHALKYLRATAKAIDNEQNRARELEDESNALTYGQRLVVDLLAAQRRAQIVGGAGSGKTHIAMLKARELARSGLRTALLCYSRGLARDFEHQAAHWPEEERPDFIGMFHRLPHWWGSTSEEPDADRDTVSRYYEEELPRELMDITAELSPDQLFDAVVVDEAQDFSSVWWDALQTSVKDREDGILWVFTDEHQRIFDSEGSAPITLSPFSLRENLRNTPQIAGAFAPLSPIKQRVRLGDGAPVRFVEAAFETTIERADDAVEALLDQGWQPGQVALLTTGGRHPAQVSAVDFAGWDAYWDDFFADDSVFYGHVRGFKGLERSVVVLAVNSKPDWDHAAEMLYVGMSRARSLLVVVGDPRAIEGIAGPDVMKALRAGERWTPPQA